MPRSAIDLRARPLLDIVSYGQGARGERLPLSRAQIEQIARTARRAPEVMIKVLSKDTNNAKSVRNHINYIGRRGQLELEGDDGVHWSGKKIGKELLDDWDLDLEASRREAEFKSTRGRVAPKLVHKLIFSMPPGTPSQGVLAAVRNFAREEFALKHRYAMVLHTDEPHPHVHVVVKAVSEQGERLSISKTTLREWRAQFARYLRAQGIAANATERAVRGQSRGPLKDGIYRAGERCDSTYLREWAVSVAEDLLKRNSRAERGKSTLVATRAKVVTGWTGLAHRLATEGHCDLAMGIQRFVDQMLPPRTGREWVAEGLRQHLPLSTVQDRNLNR